MSQSPNKPDLSRVDYREGGDVQEQHHISAREKEEPASANHPVSLVMFAICAALLLLGGGFYGQMSGGFNFNQLVASGYIPAPDPNSSGEVVEQLWSDMQMAQGKKIYTTCGGCHKSAGEGDAAQNIPPLAGSEWVTSDNTERLAIIILHGLKGPIEVNGKMWSGNNMASQAASAGDAKSLAAVMNYIRHSFGNEETDPYWISEEMAEAAFAISEETGSGQVTAEILMNDHDKPLPGEPADPATGGPLGADAGGDAEPAAEEEPAAAA